MLSQVKLLLLGSASAGKSTFAKQLKILFLNGFSEAEFAMYREQVWFCVWRNMRTLAAVPEIREGEVSALCPRLMQSFTVLHEGRVTEFGSYGPEMKILWQREETQRALELLKSKVDYSIRYFMREIDRICMPNYTPSTEDILNVRTKTLGIIETEFVFRLLHVKLVDVGGQKNERRKWIHAFQDATAVVFIVALTDYEGVLEEDGEV